MNAARPKQGNLKSRKPRINGIGADSITDSTKKYIKQLEAGKEGADKFSLSHREVQMVTNELVKGMPALGHIIADLANPFTAATFAIGATVGQMMEISRQMEELTNQPSPDWTVQTNGLKTLEDAYDNAAVSPSGGLWSRA